MFIQLVKQLSKLSMVGQIKISLQLNEQFDKTEIQKERRNVKND